MERLKDLIARTAQPGRVTWIGLRSVRRAEMDSVAAACVTPDGVQGDHARPGKRAVTLIQHEHLSVIGAMLGRDPVAPQVMRRNIVVAGVNLAALKGRRIVIGGAVLEITTICAPCSRMEEALGAGGYSAVRGHGGWCARVITPGEIALGAAVHPD